ncbi:putative cation transporter [Leishmania braziliensis MHOM/BR/75/M2904]|uniref:Cation transporter n=2 Tax=Leishmania braziliensis TaxID=5660 RepID=A4HFQ2_LEIBR|nr:putative cation transporter [Leishmania braziliensis MHOM/BR/75/M2904]CAJ2475272.1 unnamed protein product [Leishmania braziliensis]CAM45415.1 putative cation transporter [Leishmania braziliensis MHOM/BR/75/M2904]
MEYTGCLFVTEAIRRSCSGWKIHACPPSLSILHYLDVILLSSLHSHTSPSTHQMHFPIALLGLAASACLVFTYHSARLSGTSIVWFSSFAALLTFFVRLPRVLWSKATACDIPREKSRLLSAGACALLFVSGTYGLTTLGALRFACACACTAGAHHIAQLRRSQRHTKIACTVLSYIILVFTSDPGKQNRTLMLYGLLGVFASACAVSLSMKEIVTKAGQTAFLFAACGLSLMGFIITLLQRKPIVENEMLLLLAFCISGIVLAGCFTAGLRLQGSVTTFVAAIAGMSAASVVCGEKVFPAVSDWESLALLTSAGLIFVAHKGLTFADASVVSLNVAPLNSAQMLKKTKQHCGNNSVIVTLLSNPREYKLFVFLLLTVVIMLLEFIYGLAVNSLGLVSDSFHMMLDGTSIMIGLYAAHAASWLPDEKTHPFGYARYEVFGGFVNGILLLFIALYVMVESVQRFLDPPEIEGPYLLLVSVTGLAVNVVGVLFFHDAHGHSHSALHEDGGGHVDHNMRGVYLHILADLLGSVSVIISSTLMYMFGLWIADPICSAISAILVLLSAFPLLEETGRVLLLSAPSYERNYSDELRKVLLETALLQDVESPKLWMHSTAPRELTICTVAGKLRNNTDYTSAREKITETVTAHMLRHLDVHNVSLVLHLE